MSADSDARNDQDENNERNGAGARKALSSGLIALCVVAGQHQRSADPLQLARALGFDPAAPFTARVVLEEHMRKARAGAHATKLAEARSTVEEKTAALAAAEATLKKYQETTQIADERESSARPLVETGAISRVDYLQLKEDLAQNRNDLAAQEKTVQQAQAAAAGSERAFEQVERDRVADIYNDLNQRVTSEPALKGDLDKSKHLYDLKWLRAPVSGLVQKVEVTTAGQVVTPAQSLVTIAVRCQQTTTAWCRRLSPPTGGE